MDFQPTRTLSSVEENHFAVTDGTIHYSISGKGKQDIIWVHGLPLDGSSWYAQKLYFDEKYRNICIDLRGYGQSSRLPQPIANVTDLYVADLLALCKHLSLSKPIIVGFASGGHGTLRFAAQHPKALSKLVLINSSPKFDYADDWPWGFKAETLNEFISQIAKANSNDELASILFDVAMNEPCLDGINHLKQWFTTMLTADSKETINAFFTNIAYDDDRPLLKNIIVPTLIMSSKLGKEVPADTAFFMQKMIAQSQLVEINDIDHFAFATKSQLVNQLIEQFIAPECDIIIPAVHA
jgi:non-heme chloroperoxidase